MADKTKYIVLEEGSQDTWEVVGDVAATGSERACRDVFSALATDRAQDNRPGEVRRLVAVPERSWQPVTYEVEQVVKVKVSRG